jgi:hypothetical protein
MWLQQQAVAPGIITRTPHAMRGARAYLQHWRLRAIWLLHVASQVECPYAAVVVLQQRTEHVTAGEPDGIAA